VEPLNLPAEPQGSANNMKLVFHTDTETYQFVVGSDNQRCFFFLENIAI
jgi:hypothetical protein